MSACDHLPPIETDNYVGPDRRSSERRDCDDHIHRVVHEKVGNCKNEIYKEIHGLRADMSKVNDRLNILSDDVHKLGLSVRDIANNSQDIATSLRDMREMAATYRKVRGAWDVIDWVRRNVVTLGVVLVILYYVIIKGDVVQLLGGVLP